MNIYFYGKQRKNLGRFLFRVIPIGFFEQLFGLLVLPEWRQEEQHGAQATEEVDAPNYGDLVVLVPVLPDLVGHSDLDYRAQVEDVNEHELVDEPDLGVGHSCLNETVANARKRCAHLEQEARQCCVVAHVHVGSEGKADESDDVVNVKFFAEDLVSEVEVAECWPFEHEES